MVVFLGSYNGRFLIFLLLQPPTLWQNNRCFLTQIFFEALKDQKMLFDFEKVGKSPKFPKKFCV